jgi:hypothetical protein
MRKIMNGKTPKFAVRSNFKYAREMMRLAEEAMRSNSTDFDRMEEIANEMMACVATFAQYVEEKREEQS